MSQIDFSRAPEGATHFLAAERVEDTAWFRMVGDRVHRWFPIGGSGKQFSWAPIDFLPPMSEAIPVVVPDFSVAPKDATHYLVDGPCLFWYQVGKSIYRWANHGWVFEHDLPKLLKIIPDAAGPDWSKGPSNATHFGPARGRFHEAFFQLVAGSWLIAQWENDWFWREYRGMGADRLAMLIVRPAPEPAPFGPCWATAPDDATHHTRDKCEAPWRKVVGDDVFMWHRGAWELIGMPAGLGEYVPRPAVEFVPRDFGGEVRDYGPSSIDPVGLAEWGGSRIPPIGVDCLVTPTSTQWGFDSLDTRRVKVLAGYGGEYVWLMELHSDGSESLVFITTRSDKVDFAPYRTPEQVASDKRIAAAQEWLKGVEEQYGKEAADKCEDILMDFEKRKKAGAQS